MQYVNRYISNSVSLLEDPHVVSHCAAALAADLIWFRFAVFYFLRGRCYLLFTLCVFIAGQAILGHREESFEDPDLGAFQGGSSW